MIHIVTIDLEAPGLKLFVTPGEQSAVTDGMETVARTTSEFLKTFELQLAVNAGYFYPFREKTPWNTYPHPGDRVNVVSSRD